MAAVRILVEVERGVVAHVFCDQEVEVVVRDNDIAAVGGGESEVYMEGEYNPHAVADAFGETKPPFLAAAS